MSTSLDIKLNGNGAAAEDNILRPRALRPVHSSVLQAQNDDGLLGPGFAKDANSSGQTSGRSTPIPHDAPPSAHSISSARKQLRAEGRRRIFPTIEYASRVSHFDPKSDYRDFRGFFVLFWITLTIMATTAMLRNIKDTGHFMRVQIWQLFTVKVWEMALADALMVGSSAISLPFHRIFRSKMGYKLGLRWATGGVAIQSIYQCLWMAFWVAIPFLRAWAWTAQVFLILHTFVMLMKMHSYAFYNGHLSETEHRLHALDEPSTASKAPAYQYPSTGFDKAGGVKERRGSEAASDTLKNAGASLEVARLREDLAIELTSPMGSVTYPKNLTWSNWVDYIFCPTLCYELEYPRTAKRNWAQLGIKILAVFGIIFLLTTISEEYILPVLDESALRLKSIHLFSERVLVLAESVSMLLFPFTITFLLVFLVIFEYALNGFAEVTCFADRHFYSDWWNSTDWLEFSREWNVPVHHFFLRHVYSASRPHIGKPMATLITFLISAIGHEIVMACITKKLRGYGFAAQMSQLPIVMLQKTEFMKGKKVLNNVCFWCSMILGLSLMCSLYVLF